MISKKDLDMFECERNKETIELKLYAKTIRF